MARREAGRAAVAGGGSLHGGRPGHAGQTVGPFCSVVYCPVHGNPPTSIHLMRWCFTVGSQARCICIHAALLGCLKSRFAALAKSSARWMDLEIESASRS